MEKVLIRGTEIKTQDVRYVVEAAAATVRRVVVCEQHQAWAAVLCAPYGSIRYTPLIPVAKRPSVCAGCVTSAAFDAEGE